MGKYLGALKVPVLEHNDNFMESPFGERIYKGKKEQHNGIDLHYGKTYKNDMPDNILAIEDGKVTKTGYSSTRGYFVEIKHNASITSLYYHMRENSIRVMTNQLVRKGDILGITGMTGSADSIHLHLAIRKSGKYVDPLPYLNGEISINGDWETNVDYRTTKKKFKRYAPCVGNNKVPYDVLSATDEKKCDNINGKARTKIGVIYKFYKYEFDNKGNRWGCTTNPTNKQKKKHWICVEDNTGLQVEKV